MGWGGGGEAVAVGERKGGRGAQGRGRDRARIQDPVGGEGRAVGFRGGVRACG